MSALVERIASRGPLRGVLVDRNGRPRQGRLTRVDLFSILVAGDFDPGLRAAAPGAFRAALLRDVMPLLRLRRRAFQVDAVPPPPSSLSSAVYAATSCEEVSLPWARTTPPDPAERHRQAEAQALTVPDSAFAPFDRATALASDTLDLCESWPDAPRRRMRPGAAAGRADADRRGRGRPAHAVENARRVAELFPRSTLVVAPATGHSAVGSDFSGCADRAFKRFLANRPVQTRCRRYRRTFQPTPPPPTRLSAVQKLRGSSGGRGRALEAVKETVFDVADDAYIQILGQLSLPPRHRARWRPAGRALPAHERQHAEAARGCVRARHDAQRRAAELPGAPAARLAQGRRRRGAARPADGPPRPDERAARRPAGERIAQSAGGGGRVSGPAQAAHRWCVRRPPRRATRAFARGALRRPRRRVRGRTRWPAARGAPGRGAPPGCRVAQPARAAPP